MDSDYLWFLICTGQVDENFNLIDFNKDNKEIEQNTDEDNMNLIRKK